MANHEFLEKLTLAPGVPGFEKEVTRIVKDYLSDSCDEFMYDALGSIVAVKKGTGNLKVLMTGHVDEIGFVVKQIDDKGFIKVHPLGGWFGKNISSSLMEIITRDGKRIKAVFGSSMPRGKAVKTRTEQLVPADALLDIGVDSKEEAKQLGIRIGDPVVPVSEFTVMANPKYLISKAWDDRAGVAVICEVMKKLKDKQTKATIYGAGTIQEEVGCRGAKTVGQMIQPDVAFALDVCFSNDVPEEGIYDDVKLGCGVVLGVLDGSAIAHTGLLKQMEAICESLDISFVHDVLAGGGTDSGELSKVGAGVINMTLSIPSRYMHSHRTIICEDDIDRTATALARFCELFDENMLHEMEADKR